MPIKNTSNITQLPRLGKIHLGEKVEGSGKSPYPKATDYFICPKEIQDVYGEKPKQLDIMFPSDDIEEFAPQYLKCYTQSQGLVCKGDGETCRRKVDTETGETAGSKTAVWEWRDDLPCNPQECDEFLNSRCKRIMILRLLIPSVEGLGVWQIDTGSYHSIVRLNSIVKLLKGLTGRCSFIPLQMTLEPIEVSPKGQKKQTVYVLSFKQPSKLQDLLSLGPHQGARLLLPGSDEEEPPEDLYPAEVIAEKKPEAPKTEEAGPKPKVDDTIKSLRQQLHVKAKEFLGEDGYESKVKPHMKEKYGVTSATKLEEAELRNVFNWITESIRTEPADPSEAEPPSDEIATPDDRKELAKTLKDAGYATREQAVDFIKGACEKDDPGNLTKLDIKKTYARLKEIEAKAGKEEQPPDSEVADFLAELDEEDQNFDK